MPFLLFWGAIQSFEFEQGYIEIMQVKSKQCLQWHVFE